MDEQLSLFASPGAARVSEPAPAPEAAPAPARVKRPAERRLRKPRKAQPCCADCGARIVWVRTAKAGKAMPCDLKMEYGDGRKTLVTHGGQVIVKAGPDVLGRQPHFGTCPNRKTQPEPAAPATAPAEDAAVSAGHFYCPDHDFTPPPFSGFVFCPYCEAEAL